MEFPYFGDFFDDNLYVHFTEYTQNNVGLYQSSMMESLRQMLLLQTFPADKFVFILKGATFNT